MRIQDLPLESDIILEVEQKDSTFCVQSKVLEYFSDGIAIAPILVQGKVLDIGVKPFLAWKYNVYAYVGKNKKRITWKNVQLEMLHLAEFGNVYYLRTYAFAKESVSGERRTDMRYKVEPQGIVKSGDLEFHVSIHDVSSMGISFLIDAKDILPEPNLMIRFSDDTNGGFGMMELYCQVARRVGKGEQTLIGCRITKYNGSYISYIRYLNRKCSEETK